jgi:hypothetical protein
MKREEALKVARVLGTADHGCCNCVGALLDEITKEFPEFNWKEVISEVDEDIKEYIEDGTI